MLVLAQPLSDSWIHTAGRSFPYSLSLLTSPFLTPISLLPFLAPSSCSLSLLLFLAAVEALLAMPEQMAAC
jgi:hypothetical protein